VITLDFGHATGHYELCPADHHECGVGGLLFGAVSDLSRD